MPFFDIPQVKYAPKKIWQRFFLGFRGEALSSISAIAQVEVITKTKESDFGVKYTIEGGVEKGIEDVGAPEGTTFLVHQIFYNTPARRKFLKTPMTEASHVNELMIRLARRIRKCCSVYQ